MIYANISIPVPNCSEQSVKRGEKIVNEKKLKLMK
jgi:hypothetical protein